MNQSRQLESMRAACSPHALKGLPCPQDVYGRSKVRALRAVPGEEQCPSGDTPKACAHPMGIYEKSSCWASFLKVGNLLLGAVIDDNSPFGAHGVPITISTLPGGKLRLGMSPMTAESVDVSLESHQFITGTALLWPSVSICSDVPELHHESLGNLFISTHLK